VADLRAAAIELGQHFLIANCGHAKTRQQVLECVAHGFYFPEPTGKNIDALYNCLTSLLHKAGVQPGFVVVLEQLPHTPEFDKEARETLLDVFRDAADYWEKKKVPFRMFYSYA
jgi:RNAse (barnase) inhibitor barstar